MTVRRRSLLMDACMLNVAIRYFPVISLLRAMQAESVLDVGCGDGGLGMFERDRPFVGCDVRFDRPQPPMIPVAGIGGQLPFRERAFDIVVSLDTLEHVPQTARTSFLTDLARVGRRYLIVGAPCGRMARWGEYLLDRWYALRGISTPHWLEEHFRERLPDRREVEAAIASLGRPYRVYGNENLGAHLLVMLAETSDLLRPRLNRLARERLELMARLTAWTNIRPTYRLLFVIDLRETRGQ